MMMSPKKDSSTLREASCGGIKNKSPTRGRINIKLKQNKDQFLKKTE